MIQIKNVDMYYPIEKRYIEYIKRPFKRNKFTALDNITLEIETGDRVAFLGENGAGKTTLLKLIGGLLYPSKGNILINGVDTVKNNIKARKSVGFVLNEERSFYWRLTGIQNLEFFGTLDNLTGKELKEKIKETLGIVGLEEAGLRFFSGYSSGMKQRLAIARGLLCEPNILILDEPTRTLDPISAEDVKNILLKKIHDNNKRSLLIATHSLVEAVDLCNKICIMKKGHVLKYDTTINILKEFGDLKTCYKYFIDAHSKGALQMV